MRGCGMFVSDKNRGCACHAIYPATSHLRENHSQMTAPRASEVAMVPDSPIDGIVLSPKGHNYAPAFTA